MALIQCGECKRDISDKAERCPNCGAPIENQIQKPKQKGSCGGCLGVLLVLMIIGMVSKQAQRQEYAPVQNMQVPVASETPEEKQTRLLKIKADRDERIKSELEKKQQKLNKAAERDEQNKNLINAFVSEVNKIDIMNKFVERVSMRSGMMVMITVKNSWHIQIYQTRLQVAQGFEKLLKRLGGQGIFRIVDYMGNEVGGIGFAGVWVQK